MGSFTLVNKIRNKIKDKGQNNTFDISKKSKIVGCTVFVDGNNNKITIEDNVVIRNTTLEIKGDNNTIHIMKNCMIGDDCYLSCKDTTSLTIKENCGLSRNIKIMTSDGHPVYHNGECINDAQDVVVNQKVWIADSVTILKGVSVGENSVIGIGSIVTKSAPNNVILAGNPARIVKTDITWEPC